MSVKKDGKKWLVQIVSKKHKIRIRRSFSNKKEATEFEHETRQNINNETIIESGIEQALAEYLKGEAKALKDFNSVKSKARAIVPYITGKTFSDVGQVAADIKSTMIQQGLKPATINRRLALLKRITNLAHDWGWIDNPVARKIKLLPGETSRHYYLTIEQVEQLAKLCPLTGSIIRIAAFTGLRRNEIFKLTQESIKNDFIILNADTKTGKPRLVPIPEQVKTEIANINLPIDRLLNYRLRKEFEAARVEMNLSHLWFHDLRHTYASLLAQAGATLQLIGKAMGHSTPIMTNRYAHLVEDNLRELADKFSNM